MEPSQLNPGDTVIPLVGLIVTTAIISGSINAAIVTWKYNHAWWLSLIAFFIGAIICWYISKHFGSLVFPSNSADNVMVVKAGSSALPLTLKAALVGSTLGLVISGLVLAFLVGGTSLVASTWVLVILVSGTVGILWGTLSALI
jgi:hypothetical protein